MGVPYAEVIGDPIAHSKSPLIHKFWLRKLGLAGDYRAVRCSANRLPGYLAGRCADPFWRGCNVTAPLKREAISLAADPTDFCARVGAANAIFRSPLGCGVAANTDVLGAAAVLDGIWGSGTRACIIGAGGAARALMHFIEAWPPAAASLVVRDVARGKRVLKDFQISGGVYPFDACEEALSGADLVINASPLGMTGMPSMPEPVLDRLAETEHEALIIDLVYSPLDTVLLRRARGLGRKTEDGITMLVAQAAPAFELFFGAKAPREHDAELRALLTS